MKNFADLTEREVLAVAISSEEEDSRIYMTFAEDLAERYPDSAKIFEEMAEEERGHRHRLLEMYEQRFGAASAADPPRGRQGISEAPPDLADQEPVARHHPQGSRDDGAAGRAILHQGRRAGRGCRRPPLARRPRRGGKGPRETRGQADRRDPQPRRARRRGQDAPAHVRAAICAAGARRTDGRLGLDAGAAVRRRLCHASELADVSGGACRLDRRRHQHGLCRSAVRRRLADRDAVRPGCAAPPAAS